MRLRIDLAYDGTEFHGWAAQPGLRTVQGTLEAALGTVLRTPVMVACAGRTDAGVHARGQVTHVDVPAEHAPDDPGRLTRRLNGVLPADVRVVTAGPAPDGFDARFSALWRRYAYRIADPQARPDPLTRGFRLTWPRPLAEEAMNAAATSLLGEHDFAAFCRRREGATTIRRLLELSSSRDSTGSIVTTVRADAFCHNMVRSLIGCLIAVGEGRRDPEWAGSVLSAAVRDPAVTVVPPQGLVLEEVAYPPDEELAERAAATRVVRSLPVAVPGGSGGPDG